MRTRKSRKWECNVALAKKLQIIEKLHPKKSLIKWHSGKKNIFNCFLTGSWSKTLAQASLRLQFNRRKWKWVNVLHPNITLTNETNRRRNDYQIIFEPLIDQMNTIMIINFISLYQPPFCRFELHRNGQMQNAVRDCFWIATTTTDRKIPTTQIYINDLIFEMFSVMRENARCRTINGIVWMHRQTLGFELTTKTQLLFKMESVFVCASSFLFLSFIFFIILFCSIFFPFE